MDEPLRILIGDDNPAILEAVTHMLENEFKVVAALDCPEAVVSQIPKLKPDILILDVSWPETNGFEIARVLTAGPRLVKIVFLTVHEELDFIRAAFAVGASGYVFKSRMNTDLKTAIRAASTDKVFIPEPPIPQYESHRKYP